MRGCLRQLTLVSSSLGALRKNPWNLHFLHSAFTHVGKKEIHQ